MHNLLLPTFILKRTRQIKILWLQKKEKPMGIFMKFVYEFIGTFFFNDDSGYDCYKYQSS